MPIATAYSSRKTSMADATSSLFSAGTPAVGSGISSPLSAPAVARHLTDDPYRHARNLSGWRRELVQLSPGRFTGQVIEVQMMAGLRTADEAMSRSAFHIGGAYPGGMTLGVVQSRNGETVIWNGQKVGANTVVCAFDDTELVLRSYEHCRMWWLFVPWQMFGEHEEIRHCVSEQKEAAMLCLEDERLAARLRTCVREVRQHLRAWPADGPPPADFLAAVQEEVVGIAGGFARGYVAVAPCLGAGGSHAMRILRMVRRYLRDNVGESISLLDLCDAASTSERTIRNACEMITGESPIAFLRAMRLNQVRRCLLNATTPVCVSEIGMRWGFLHMPQFSKDYRYLFFELPSETIRRQLMRCPHQAD